jgi:hypothetical protein
MQKSSAITAATICALLGGCAGWQSTAQTTLATAHKAAQGAAQIGVPLIRKECRTIAEKCAADSVPVSKCTAIHACHEKEKTFQRAIAALQLAVYAAYGALALDDQHGTTNAVNRVLGLLSGLQTAMKEGGLL